MCAWFRRLVRGLLCDLNAETLAGPLSEEFAPTFSFVVFYTTDVSACTRDSPAFGGFSAFQRATTAQA